MTRDNLIFLIGGLVLGLIVGGTTIGPMVSRVSAASAQPAASAEAPQPATAEGMPSAPAASGAAGGAPNGPPMAEVQRQLAALKAQITADPKNFDALVQLGNMYMDVSKFDQATQYYERAVAVREDANVRTDLGICYKQMGQLEKSLSEFQRVQELTPDQWQATYNEVIILAELRRFDEARTRFAALQKARPGDEDVAKLGQALAAAK
ncbi:MAG: tetratricopeptide repeat protein [Acidobacteria bacterium]|nr:tetratricopeptide repeat protein [Acidobacteriota bacterium]